jgi:hypothetical protein
MRYTALWLFIAAAVVTVAAAHSNVVAAPAKQAACTSLKDEAGCGARDDCQWTAAVVDSSGKEKRKASCKRKPAAAKKK